MRILVVEDEPKIRHVLMAYLEKEGWENDYTGDGHEAVAMHDYNQYDLILLDLKLNGLSGEEVCTRIREKSNVPIIMITSKSREDDVINGLHIGADDYILKPFRVKEVIAHIQALFRRMAVIERQDTHAARTSFDQGRLIVDFDAREVLVRGVRAHLTETEFKLLSIVACEPKRVFSRSDLYYRVLGYRFQGDGRTIDMHVRNLRKKIEADAAEPRYVVTKVGQGYQFAMQPDG
ncbi:response regulator transcription factor [Paenibacillus sp. J5C_2022]|uniref:response regulator transcription factor n=1 Tax=Paenibacillus sp. J5C2022 TaxID=2977129 RepID=UPI0021D2779B|nr:response regulator transcription factor [Paenibacillus sp. J5C2022]MCU6710201.1 response regulator transcription factor [Paenibacillus sp. J5C2022]